MDTKKTLLALGVVTLLLVAAFLFFPSPENEPDLPDGATTTPSDIAFSVETESARRETDVTLIEISYPRLVGSAPSLEIINQTIEREVQVIQSSFEESITEIDMGFVPLGAKSGLYIEYEDVVEGENTVSIPLLVSEYVAGAAHPNNYMRTLTFSLGDGSALELRNLFEGADYLDMLSDMSREALRAGNVDEQYVPQDSEWLTQGTAPLEENFQEFLIDGENLIIIFNPYQVAPYAAGIMRAVIPLSELTGFRN
jgi:hypothetical protein